jgi:hypothetical protein
MGATLSPCGSGFPVMLHLKVLSFMPSNAQSKSISDIPSQPPLASPSLAGEDTNSPMSVTTPSSLPFNTPCLVDLPTFVVMLEGSVKSMEALTATLSKYIENALHTSGVDSLMGIGLVLIKSEPLTPRRGVLLLFFGTATFGIPNPQVELAKAATLSALENSVALGIALASNSEIGEVILVWAYVDTPTPKPSSAPSSSPSQGATSTICTIQHTQAKCLAHDCEWRNRFRMCRDFLRHETLDQDVKSLSPSASNRGNEILENNEVPHQNPVVIAFICIALVAGSIAILGIFVFSCEAIPRQKES